MNKLTKMYNSIYYNNKYVMIKWVEPLFKASVFFGSIILIIVALYNLADIIR